MLFVVKLRLFGHFKNIKNCYYTDIQLISKYAPVFHIYDQH